MIFYKKYRVNRVISLAETYLRNKIIKGEYGLSCKNQYGKQMFSHNRGHCFSIFFITEVFKNDLPEDLRSIFISRILSEEFQGLWGYSPRGYYIEQGENPYFVDADDSAFVLRSLRNMDIYRDNSILNFFLGVSDEFVGLELYSTFKSKFKCKIENIQIDSNHFGFHPEVNGNVYHLLLNTNNQTKISKEYIRFIQDENGQWPCFFYKNNYYATCLYIDLLKKMNEPSLSLNLKKGILFLRSELKKMIDSKCISINPYSLSLVLLSIFQGFDKDELFEKGIELLLKSQNKDGSWTNNEVFWFFKDSYGFDWISYDVNKIISTSSCLMALKILN